MIVSPGKQTMNLKQVFQQSIHYVLYSKTPKRSIKWIYSLLAVALIILIATIAFQVRFC